MKINVIFCLDHATIQEIKESLLRLVLEYILTQNASQMDSNCHTNLIELGLPEAFSHLKTSMNNT